MENIENKKKNGKTKYILSILFMIVLIVLTLVTIFNKYDINELMSVIKTIDYKWIMLGVLMIFIYIYFEGLAMKILFKSMNVRVGIWPNFVYSAIDYYFCAVTPSATGGQPMVAYYMKKDGVPLSYVTLCLLVNTALFKIVLLLLSLISFILYPGIVFSSWLMIALFLFGFLFNVFFVALCFMIAFKRDWVERVGVKCIGLLRRMKIVKNYDGCVETFRSKMNEYEEGARHIRSHKKDFVLALLSNLIQRVALFSVAYFVFLGFHQTLGIDMHSYFELLAIQVLIALCVDSLPLPGGIGISEFLYIGLLGFAYTFNGAAASDDMIASAMLVTRAVNFYIPVIITGIIVVLKQLFNILKKGK